MFACVCWTPFQILNAINYKFQYATDEQIDFYICQKFKDADLISERLKKLEYVENVYLVKNLDYDSLSGWRKKWKITSDLFFSKRTLDACIVDKVDLERKQYSYVLSSGYLNFNILFNCYMKKRGAKCYFMDDGIESYLLKNTADGYSKFYKFVSNLTKNGGTQLEPEALYVYAPSLVSNKRSYKTIKCLPSITQLSAEIKSDLQSVFDVHVDTMKETYLVLDQIGTGDFRNTDFIRIQEQIFDLICSRSSSDNLAIKMHPRADKKVYDAKYKTFFSSVPWELFIMNQEIEKKVLLALTSTACLTPKIIYDAEPNVIFLYKLFDIDNSQIIEEFIERAKCLYQDSTKIHIPENIQELDAVLQEIERVNGSER